APRPRAVSPRQRPGAAPRPASSAVTRRGRSAEANSSSRSWIWPNGCNAATGGTMVSLSLCGARSGRGGRHRAGLVRLARIEVALPAFVLELDVLDRDGIGVGVEIGNGVEFAHPAAIDLVALDGLAAFVVDQKDHVLWEVLQVHGGVAGVGVDQVRPLLELEVVGDAALQRDRLVGRAPGRLVVGAVLAALAVLDDFRGALERAHLADAEHHAAVPHHLELEVLVRVDAMRVDDESFRHGQLPTADRRRSAGW